MLTTSLKKKAAKNDLLKYASDDLLKYASDGLFL